ncbi:RICIN domain-containing protein [Streptomyces sp. URMC 129]|uniref:RICIN domain-containing protein n=1 Tax=Streptomyces sp. URMC 129 TaxID=3423407 RepID=UPI003F1B79DD
MTRQSDRSPSPGRGGQDIAAVEECVAGGAEQQWDVSDLPLVRQVRNVATGRCLQDGGAGVAVMGPCGGQLASLWVATGPEDARQLRNLASGQCLAALPGIGVAVVGACSDAANQRWGIDG